MLSFTTLLTISNKSAKVRKVAQGNKSAQHQEVIMVHVVYCTLLWYYLQVALMLQFHLLGSAATVDQSELAPAPANTWNASIHCMPAADRTFVRLLMSPRVQLCVPHGIVCLCVRDSVHAQRRFEYVQWRFGTHDACQR
jgi:hypothetical protein